MNAQCWRQGLGWSFRLGVVGVLSACQPTPKPPTASSTESTAVASVSYNTASAPTQTAQMASTATAPRSPQAIDWAQIDSGVKAVDKTKFDYPFALDSKPVQAYADAYHVDANSARYNLTVGMAVNEVLAKVLDQIGTAYVSHELTAGKTSEFIVHTTPRIKPSRHTYVFAEPFAHGLTIDVVIVNDGIKPRLPADSNHAMPLAQQ